MKRIRPPLATIGIGMALLDGHLALGALQLFVVNLFGIVLAGVAVFSLMGFYPERKNAEQAIKQEEKNLKKSRKRGEKKK